MNLNSKENELKKSAQGHRKRLRERFLKNGLETFADYEVVELLLTLVIPRIDVKPLAKNLLSKFGNLRGILDADIAELSAVKGVGETSAAHLHFLRKLVPIYMRQDVAGESILLDRVEKLVDLFKPNLANERLEAMDAVYLNSQLELVHGPVRVSQGDVCGANIGLRKIISLALENSAASVVIAHNHPGGRCRPSPEDIDFTKKLSLACKPIRVCVIEHLIICKNSFYSFCRNGHMDVLYDEAPDEPETGGSQDVAEVRRKLV